MELWMFRVSSRVMSVWFFFFKQKTAYELRISDWSSDVCSSDLAAGSDHCASAAFEFVQRLGQQVAGGIAAAGVIVTALAVETGERKIGGQVQRRSAERRVGKEGVRTCRSRWSPYH